MKPKLNANSISIGMLAVGVAAYAGVAAVTVYEGRPFGWAEFNMLWPMHSVMLLLVLALFAPPAR